MAATVLVPTPLQKLTNNQASVKVNGNSIAELLDSLETNFPGIKSRLCDNNGEIRRFVNFYLNSEDIRFLDGSKTAVKDGDEVSIVAAQAGG
jgi:sulfur-carrier protein